MTPLLELVGTWEEISAHERELRGHRLRVSVLPDEQPTDSRLGVLAEIESRSAGMNPKPDEIDFLREGRDGAIFGD